MQDVKFLEWINRMNSNVKMWKFGLPESFFGEIGCGKVNCLCGRALDLRVDFG